jgi:phosphoesterase RecJ-like protein
MSIEKTIACIKRSKRFLIATHINMEGDALGSELAFYKLVRSLGKEAVLVNDDAIPYGYEFLPKLPLIKRYNHELKVGEYDCFVAVDCSDLHRTGQAGRLAAGKTVLNIDHHISNSYFGTVNWVDPDACCCCELIYRLYKKMRVAFDAESALYLYVGILTDTGSFRYTNTNASTHLMVSELLGYGIDVASVWRNIWGTIPYSDLVLLTKILPTMQRDAGGKAVFFEVRKDAYRSKEKVLFDLSENILSFGRSMKGVEVVVLFKENLKIDNEVRVNFRSQGKVDVNRIAKEFGGGGHKTAAGATVKGTLPAIRKKVIAAVRKACAKEFG